MDHIRELLVVERARRVEVERQLADARATIAALQMQLASVRRPGQVLSDCSELSGAAAAAATTTPGGNTRVHVVVGAQVAGTTVPTNSMIGNKPQQQQTSKKSSPSGGVRKKKSKERTPKAKIPGQSRYWTPEEHKLFLEALRKFGHKDLRNISAYVGTRNMTQCRTHSQKYFMRLMREAKRQNPAIIAPPNATVTTASENGTTDGDNDSAADSVTVATNTVVVGSGTVVTSVEKKKQVSTQNEANSDKYSVPNTCGMTLLCLVGQDTLTN